MSNSSSFSWILRSISCRTWPSSSCERRTLFSSCSRAASASSRAAWSSSFSTSRRLRCLSSSWIERPPSPSWSRRSLISSARFLFSLLTTSSCSTASSWAAFSLKSSLLKLRHSFWLASISVARSSFSLSFPFRDDLVGKNDQCYKTNSISLSPSRARQFITDLRNLMLS